MKYFKTWRELEFRKKDKILKWVADRLVHKLLGLTSAALAALPFATATYLPHIFATWLSRYKFATYVPQVCHKFATFSIIQGCQMPQSRLLCHWSRGSWSDFTWVFRKNIVLVQTVPYSPRFSPGPKMRYFGPCSDLDGTILRSSGHLCFLFEPGWSFLFSEISRLKKDKFIKNLYQRLNSCLSMNYPCDENLSPFQPFLR